MSSSTLLSNIHHIFTNSPLWLLGTCYKLLSDDRHKQQTLQNIIFSKFLFTYRYDYQFINNTNFSTDVGWACTLRSAQMMLAQAISRLQFADNYIFNRIHSDTKELYSKYLNIIKLFEDTPNSTAPFSIHNILGTNVQQAETKSSIGKLFSLFSKEDNTNNQDPNIQSKIKVGEWLGPHQISCMIQKANINNKSQPSINIYLSDNATVYLDKLQSLVEQKPTIVLIPVRLGMDKINQDYVLSLLSVFKFKQNIGIIGGSGKSSYYIIGVQDDKLLYLDPHLVQKSVLISNYDNTEINKEISDTCHPSSIISIDVDKLDPSLAIGFLINDADDLKSWWSEINHITDSKIYKQNAFHIEEKSPQYDNLNFDADDDFSL